MSDPFSDAVEQLVGDHPVIRGVAFTDLDGEDIALVPREQRDVLRICAAYSGIALRRLGAAEQQSGRAPVGRITLEGSAGRFITLRVGDDYQLVVTLDTSRPTGSVLQAAQATADRLAAQI